MQGNYYFCSQIVMDMFRPHLLLSLALLLASAAAIDLSSLKRAPRSVLSLDEEGNIAENRDRKKSGRKSFPFIDR